MPEINNDTWLESAKECFDLSVENGDYVTCQLVIEDVFDKGFTKESLVLEQLLLAVPLETFTHPTHDFLWK